jgi:hypothetical protein
VAFMAFRAGGRAELGGIGRGGWGARRHRCPCARRLAGSRRPPPPPPPATPPPKACFTAGCTRSTYARPTVGVSTCLAGQEKQVGVFGQKGQKSAVFGPPGRIRWP